MIYAIETYGQDPRFAWAKDHAIQGLQNIMDYVSGIPSWDHGTERSHWTWTASKGADRTIGGYPIPHGARVHARLNRRKGRLVIAWSEDGRELCEITWIKRVGGFHALVREHPWIFPDKCFCGRWRVDPSVHIIEADGRPRWQHMVDAWSI